MTSPSADGSKTIQLPRQSGKSEHAILTRRVLHCQPVSVQKGGRQFTEGRQFHQDFLMSGLMTARVGYATDEPTSKRMRSVRSTDTAPERLVREILSRLGYRYRLHQRDLPGQPDIVFARARKVIFVHGCFWHRHHGCRRCSMPTRNVELWKNKFERTVARDKMNLRRLRSSGWSTLVIWECTTMDERRLEARLKRFLSAGTNDAIDCG
jgi:DNA mismatch endonuclease, patch repair protein